MFCVFCASLRLYRQPGAKLVSVTYLACRLTRMPRLHFVKIRQRQFSVAAFC